MGTGVPKHRVIRQEEMASSCSGGGLAWLLGKISLLKELRGIGTGSPGEWLSHHSGGIQKPCR